MLSRAFLIFVLACGAREKPVPPGPPIPAEPEIEVASMDDECKALIDAMAAYRDCPNMDDDERAGWREVIEGAERNFAAGKKGNPDAQAQKTIALACRRGAVSVRAANERCHAGPRPRVD